MRPFKSGAFDPARFRVSPGGFVEADGTIVNSLERDRLGTSVAFQFPEGCRPSHTVDFGAPAQGTLSTPHYALKAAGRQDEGAATPSALGGHRRCTSGAASPADPDDNHHGRSPRRSGSPSAVPASADPAFRRYLQRRSLRAQPEVLFDDLAPRLAQGTVRHNVSVWVLGHGVPPDDHLVVDDVRHESGPQLLLPLAPAARSSACILASVASSTAYSASSIAA